MTRRSSCSQRLTFVSVLLGLWTLAAVTPLAMRLLSHKDLRIWCQTSHRLTGPVGESLSWLSIAVLSSGFGIAAWMFLRGARRSSRLISQFAGLRQPVPGPVAHAACVAGISGRFWYVRYPEPVALSVGLLRPMVILSDSAAMGLTGNELTAMLLHEAAHVRHFDPLRRLFWTSLSKGFRVLPGFSGAVSVAAACWEMRADAFAAAQMGDIDGLTGAMLKMARRAMPAPTVASAGFSDELLLRAQHLSGADITPHLHQLASSKGQHWLRRLAFPVLLACLLLPACLPN